MTKKKLIVCVCRGNILRSAVAEKLIANQLSRLGQSHQYQVISRSIQGTVAEPRPTRFPNLTYYTSIYGQIKPVLDELQIDLSCHVSTPISLSTATKATTIFAMDKLTKDALLLLFPHLSNKISLFADLANKNKDITDVVYEVSPTYQIKVVKEISTILEVGIENLLSITSSTPTQSQL